MQIRSTGIPLLAAAFVIAGAARAQDIAAGKALARTSCSTCHLVDPQGQKTASDAVPTFTSIARMPSTTAASLAAFLSTPHARMPNLILTRTEITDVSAYILSLRTSP
jgi:mono/diheme cytochrome c family protein